MILAASTALAEPRSPHQQLFDDLARLTDQRSWPLLDEAGLRHQMWQVLAHLDDARQMRISPDAALEHAFRLNHTRESIRPLRRERFLRNLAFSDRYNVWDGSRDFLETGESPQVVRNGQPALLHVRPILPEPWLIEQPVDLAWYELAWEPDPPARLAPVAEAFLERYDEALSVVEEDEMQPFAETAPPATVPRQRVRVDAAFGENIDLRSFGGPSVGFRLISDSMSTVRFALLDFDMLVPVTYTTAWGYLSVAYEPFARVLTAKKEDGLPMEGTLARAYLIYSRPHQMEIYYLSDLSVPSNHRAIVFEW